LCSIGWFRLAELPEEQVINYLPIILNEPFIILSPDFRKSKLFLILASPVLIQTWAISWFITSDQRKAIFFMSLTLITIALSIRDRLLCVKEILADVN